MPFQVYILHSADADRYYCGQTDNLERRLRQHNDPKDKVTLTTHRYPGPWRLVWSTNLESRAEAMQLEKRIKKRGIKRFLEALPPSV